jgi:hypothetical protein
MLLKIDSCRSKSVGGGLKTAPERVITGHQAPYGRQNFLRGLLERDPVRRLGASQRTGHTHLNIKVHTLLDPSIDRSIQIHQSTPG